MSETSKKSAPKAEKKEVCPVIVASLVDHPITFKYDGKDVRFSGRAREVFDDGSLLENPLPQGLASKKV